MNHGLTSPFNDESRPPALFRQAAGFLLLCYVFAKAASLPLCLRRERQLRWGRRGRQATGVAAAAGIFLVLGATRKEDAFVVCGIIPPSLSPRAFIVLARSVLALVGVV